MLRKCHKRLRGHMAGDKDRERLYQERQRHMLYDRNGKLRFSGLCRVLWEEFHFPILCLIGAGLLTYGYQKMIVYMCQQESAGAALLDRQSEQVARESGKLKADRFLVKPRRQIDDPDLRDLPAHSGKHEFTSRLFTNDSYSGQNADYTRSK